MARSALLRGLAALRRLVLPALPLLLSTATVLSAAEPARPAEAGVIVAPQPTTLETEEGGVHGQLVSPPS